jgi:hypothetical protein
MTLWARMAGDIPQEWRSYATEGWVQMPAGLSIEEASGLMLVNGEWCPRPRVTALQIARGKSGWEIHSHGLPEGACCDVYDRDFHELLDDVPAERGVIAFLITDPGTYQFDITVPTPWIGLTMNVELA